MDMDTARKLVEDMLTDRVQPDIDKLRSVVLRSLGNENVNLVHMGADGTSRGLCGIVADTDHVSVEHNDVTCPLCFCIHEATCESGDDDSEFYEFDIDAIMATKWFITDCLTRVANRIGSPRHQRG